ncbi:MAG: hypothetical protein DWQ01_20190 [Planctomycetota bacterium]|nr:MAG: hypothetical protein DWQ01_20190 [Planctomycetota bacterium]
MMAFCLTFCLGIASAIGFDGNFAHGDGPLDSRPREFALKAAKIFTAGERGVINHGVIWIADGKIIQVEQADALQLPENLPVVDLGDLWLVPGMHEPHSHVGAGRMDLHDYAYLTNPDLRTLESIEPGHRALDLTVASGVTTQLVISGSGNNMSGFGTLIKSSGDVVDDLAVKVPGSLKIAQAGNPEYWGFGPQRMMMNWNTRGTLERGLEWARKYKKGEADFDLTYENFVGLEDGTVPVSVHTQIYQVVLMTITMQARDLGLKPFIDHGTFDGYRAAPEAAKYGVPAMIGPRNMWFDRTTSQIQGCAAGYYPYTKEGLLLGYNTDAPVLPQEELSYQATMGVRLGHDDPAGALEGLTSQAAQALRCDHISGSLQAGLDADIVAWSGNPLDPRSFVHRVWIRGDLVYDAEKDGRRY